MLYYVGPAKIAVMRAEHAAPLLSNLLEALVFTLVQAIPLYGNGWRSIRMEVLEELDTVLIATSTASEESGWTIRSCSSWTSHFSVCVTLARGRCNGTSVGWGFGLHMDHVWGSFLKLSPHNNLRLRSDNDR